MKMRLLVSLFLFSMFSIAVKAEAPQKPKYENDLALMHCFKSDTPNFRDYLKEHYSEQLKEIRELKKENPVAARKQFKKLVFTAQREMPKELKKEIWRQRKNSRQTMRCLMFAKENYPEEVEKLKHLAKTDKEACKEACKKLLDKSKANMPQDWRPKNCPQFNLDAARLRKATAFKMVKAKYNDELANIRAMRKQDPLAAKKALVELRKKMREDIAAHRNNFLKLVEEYRDNPKPETLAKIKEKVTTMYNCKLKFLREDIKRQEARLELQKQRLKDMENQQVEKVDRRVEKIINGFNMKSSSEA